MKRLSEASTWAGFAAMLRAVSSVLPPPWGVYLHGASAVAATLAGVIPEGVAA